MILDEMLINIKKASKIAILTHVNPDGDAIGSSLGMYLALKSIGKQVDIIIPEYSKIYNFLPAVNEIKKQSDATYDLVLGLDCATRSKIS